MWISKVCLDWLDVSRDSVQALREDLAALKAENVVLKDSLNKANIQNDWMRIQVNSLQNERTSLLEKAHGIRVPSPQMMKVQETSPANHPLQASFDDMGDDMAHAMGLPLYFTGTTQQ